MLSSVKSLIKKTRMNHRHRQAVAAVRSVTDPVIGSTFSAVSPDAPIEENWTEIGLEHAISNPREYFMCAGCGDGPWHRSWTGIRNRELALGPCCTGAD